MLVPDGCQHPHFRPEGLKVNEAAATHKQRLVFHPLQAASEDPVGRVLVRVVLIAGHVTHVSLNDGPV